jgi:hypothetical protein
MSMLRFIGIEWCVLYMIGGGFRTAELSTTDTRSAIATYLVFVLVVTLFFISFERLVVRNDIAASSKGASPFCVRIF